MRYLMGMIMGAALAATPAAAQDNEVAVAVDANTSEIAAEPAADPALNGMAAAPEVVEPIAAPVETTPARPARKDGFPWGILGLLGLVGLLGRMRR